MLNLKKEKLNDYAEFKKLMALLNFNYTKDENLNIIFRNKYIEKLKKNDFISDYVYKMYYVYGI